MDSPDGRKISSEPKERNHEKLTAIRINPSMLINNMYKESFKLGQNRSISFQSFAVKAAN
jgi:hypothetical protein